MENKIDKGLTENLHFRFGQTAVDKGFVTSEHLKKALDEQIDNDVPLNRLRPRRAIGEIFLEKGWMTPKQIKIVLNQILKNK
jgi:hypothetical protein